MHGSLRKPIASPLYLLGLSFLCLGLGSCSKELKRADRPNILFILTDDQRADAMGCAGNAYIRTPNTDRLASGGTRFSNAYIQGGHHGAVCAPSRAMLLTGQNLFTLYSGYEFNTWVEEKVLNDLSTMPAYFAKEGYLTFGTGKWHHGALSFESSFQLGAEVFLGGMSDHFRVPCRDLESNGLLGEVEYKSFSTDLFAGAALDFIDDYARTERDQPFFCYVSFTAPHDPRSPAGDYRYAYDPASVPVPGNFMEYHPFAFDNMQIRDEVLAPWPRKAATIQASLAEYYSLITHIDDRVGEIMEALKRHDLYDNTIVVYTSDNGLALGSHGLLGKQCLYEHSTRVPLILSGPGIPAGKQTAAFAYLFDLFPTLCDLSGISLPAALDGRNLAPVLRGDAEGVRSSVFTAYRNTVRAVRDGEWKLIRYPDRDYTQLFHLESDPLEINNLAEDPDYRTRVDELMDLLQKSQSADGDTIPLTAAEVMPMAYDPLEFTRTPDPFQPEYILKKYFSDGHDRPGNVDPDALLRTETGL